MARCDFKHNCFNCPHPDCIVDDENLSEEWRAIEDEKERKREYQKQYREKNREKIRMYRREYYLKNKEKEKLYHKKYMERRKAQMMNKEVENDQENC